MPTKELIVPEVGAKGYYFSLRRGQEDPRHGERCKVIARNGSEVELKFDNPEFDTVRVDVDQDPNGFHAL